MNKALMCNLDYNLFTDEYFPNYEEMASKHNYYTCPVIGCFGKIMPIDKNIAVAVSILNKKGYFTESSGEGNPYVYGDNVYVKFIFDYSADFQTLPKGFKYIDKEKFILSGTQDYDSSELIEKQSTLLQNAQELLLWAYKLPEYEFNGDEQSVRENIFEKCGKMADSFKHLDWQKSIEFDNEYYN
jgi:hypothetical protein